MGGAKKNAEAEGATASRATEVLGWPSADRAERGAWHSAAAAARQLSSTAWTIKPAGTDAGSCLAWARVLSGTDDAGQSSDWVLRISVSIVVTQHG